MQSVAVCCSVLQCDAVCRSHTWNSASSSSCRKSCFLLQCVAVFWSVLQCVPFCCSVLQLARAQRLRADRAAAAKHFPQVSALKCVAVCCSCSVLQCVACVAVCCSRSYFWSCRQIVLLSQLWFECNTLLIWLQHTATHCNTLQHTATHCNTLQHTATLELLPNHSTTSALTTPAFLCTPYPIRNDIFESSFESQSSILPGPFLLKCGKWDLRAFYWNMANDPIPFEVTLSEALSNLEAQSS